MGSRGQIGPIGQAAAPNGRQTRLATVPRFGYPPTTTGSQTGRAFAIGGCQRRSRPDRRGRLMGLGTITLLGMLCTPGQAPADVTAWNSASMKIPIDYHPSKRAEIKGLLLYVSPDQGQ